MLGLVARSNMCTVDRVSTVRCMVESRLLANASAKQPTGPQCCVFSCSSTPTRPEQVPPGYAPFTFGQRVGAVVRNGELSTEGHGVSAQQAA